MSDDLYELDETDAEIIDLTRRLPAKPDEGAIVIDDLSESMEDEPAPAWIWDGYIAAGWVSLIVGPPKVGKTSILCALFDAMRRGQPLLERPTKRVGVLLLTEQAPGTFKETLGNFGFTVEAGDVAVMYRWKQPAALDWPELIQQAVDEALAQGRKIVIVDTFARWAEMRHDHDATEILRCLEPLNRAAQAGLAILIVHHSRKAGGSHGLEVSGRAEIAGQVDVILSLRRAGAHRKIVGDGRSMQTPPEIVFAAGDGGLSLVEMSDKDAAAEQVLAALTELGQATYYDLMDATGLPRTSVQSAVNALLERGDAQDAGKRGKARLFSC